MRFRLNGIFLALVVGHVYANGTSGSTPNLIQKTTQDDRRFFLGRYTFIKAVPTDQQKNLLSVMVDIRFPSSIYTVGDAVQYLLKPSGFRLAEGKPADPYQNRLLYWPLPEVHRALGPMPLQDALETLAGSSYMLVMDPVNRLVSYELDPYYRRSYAERSGTKWVSAGHKDLDPDLVQDGDDQDQDTHSFLEDD